MSTFYLINMITYIRDDFWTTNERLDDVLQLVLGLLVIGVSYLHLFQQQRRLVDPNKVTIAGFVSTLAVLIAANVNFNPDL